MKVGIRTDETMRWVLALVLCLICRQAACFSYEDIVSICAKDRSTHGRQLASSSCNTYFTCFAGTPLLRRCPPGTEFDLHSGFCNTMTYRCRNQLLYQSHIVETQHKNFNNVQTKNNRVIKKSYNDIIAEIKDQIKAKMRTEARMARRLEGVIDSGPFRYVSAWLYAKPLAKHMSYPAQVLLEAHKLKKEGKMSKSPELNPSTQTGRPDMKVEVSHNLDECPYPTFFHCSAAQRYRTVDGSCNNLRKPIWGRSNIPHRRLIEAQYGDGIQSMRDSVRGGSLISAREVSRHLFADMDRPNSLNSLTLMTWGQFVDHDLTRTAITMCDKDPEGFGRTTELKCGNDGCQKEGPGVEQCWPIPVSVEDPDFGRTNTCIKFVRSEPTPPLDCKSAHREQLNQVTPWIDGSNVYGGTPEEAEAVRDHHDSKRGKLKTRKHPHGRHLKPVLPIFDDLLCRDTNTTHRCFLAGDERVNENAALASMHTIWVREHNRIEEKLHKINPHWQGERLFQETRRIVIAMMQNILIHEQFFVLLGPKLMRQYDLTPVDHGYYYGYDPNIDPRITQAFATAAYRLGHTLIQEHFKRIHGGNRGKSEDLLLSHTFFRPGHVYDIKNGGIDGLLRGLSAHTTQTYDTFFTKQITRSLFTEKPPHGPGMDLLSLNIQRGRDHGLPGYNDYRELCGRKRLRSFDDLIEDIPNNQTRKQMQKVYKHVDDIELFPGGICERSVPGGIVGPTFGCILGEQIRSLRKGDRFWYENSGNLAFTPGQLKQIRKMRLSKVMCANSDDIHMIQPWVLMKPFSQVKRSDYDNMSPELRRKYFSRTGNAPTLCSSLPDIDVRYWRE